MNRRTLLRRTSPLASLAALAGCLGSTTPGASDGHSGSGTTTERGATTTEPAVTTTGTAEGTERDATTTDSDDSDDFTGVGSEADEPFRSLSVGSREGVAFPDNNRPHRVRVWNDADDARELTVRVFRDARELLDRTVAFDADAFLEVTLNEPGDYRVAVGLAGEEPTTVRVERSRFDCNASTTDVGVGPEGRVRTTAFSTLMGCPAPEVAATDLSVGEGECGTDHGASVAFDGERVRVEGRVGTPDPGYDLELADASYDPEADELEVRVRATEGDLAGVQCVGVVPYEAEVAFEHDLPGEVVVVHASDNDAVEVTRSER